MISLYYQTSLPIPGRAIWNSGVLYVVTGAVLVALALAGLISFPFVMKAISRPYYVSLVLRTISQACWQ